MAIQNSLLVWKAGATLTVSTNLEAERTGRLS
jgi:hypothetical protein